MEKHCENCDCVRTWTEDEARGELVCQTCGLVEEYQPDTEAGDNAGTVGEERFREAVDRVHGRGPGTVPRAEHTDANGRPITPAMYWQMLRWERRERGYQRPTEPMFYQLLNLVEELYGRNIAYHLYFLIDAVTRRLTPEQEAIRQEQKSCEKEALNLPKNVIAHSDDTVRGAGDRDMLVLMAIAIRLLAYEFGIAVQINPVTEAERHGLTVRQVRNVKRIILKYYKARCRHGFSKSPSTVMNRRDLRQNDASIHSMNMLEQLTPLLTSEQLSRVSDAFWSTLADIGEPDVDAHTQNESFDLVCGAVMMATLQRFGLADNKASAVARGIGERSPLAVMKLLERLRNDALEGRFPAGNVLLPTRNDSSEGCGAASPSS